MLRRINKIKNVGRFAELKSHSGTQGDFSKLNVIYAPNASGKSTICDVLRSLTTGRADYITGRKRFGVTAGIEVEVLLQGVPAQKHSLLNGLWQTDPLGTHPPIIMVYDDRFVSENVLVGHHVDVEQRRNLYGLVIGARGLGLKQQVDAAEQELSTATSAFNSAKTALNSVIPNGWQMNIFRTLPKDDEIDEQIRKSTEELEKAKRTQQNADAIRKRDLLILINPPAIPSELNSILETTLDEITLRAEGQILGHLKEHSRNLSLEWLGAGHRGQIGTGCPHCGQEMEGLGILKAYRAFFSGALQQQQAAQQEISNAIDEHFGGRAQQQLQQLLNAHVAEREWWHAAVGFEFELPEFHSITDAVSKMEEVRNALTGAVRRKQEQPSAKVELSQSEQDALAKWKEMANKLSVYNASLAPINADITARKIRAGSVDLATISKRIALSAAQKRRYEPEVIKSFATYDLALSVKENKERAKTSANDALRQQSEQIFQDYGKRINELLQTFQVDFKIVGGAVNFRGGQPSGELAVEILGTRVSSSPDDARNPALPSLANTLSGGDRSALGLAFFLAVVEHDINLTSTAVVFDDPFHSQDRSRRRRTIECIQTIAQACSQCFVLSHDLDFAREAARIGGVAVQTFKIDPMSDHSLLQPGELPPLPGRAYEQDYAKLKAYIRNQTAFASQLKDVARCIRQTLEGYLRAKFPESWAENDWFGDMIRKIREAQTPDLLQLADHLVTELAQVNDWGKRYYHAESDRSDASEIDPRELKGYVEQTIRIISR